MKQEKTSFSSGKHQGHGIHPSEPVAKLKLREKNWLQLPPELWCGVVVGAWGERHGYKRTTVLTPSSKMPQGIWLLAANQFQPSTLGVSQGSAAATDPK